jgi:hypothetical protein
MAYYTTAAAQYPATTTTTAANVMPVYYMPVSTQQLPVGYTYATVQPSSIATVSAPTLQPIDTPRDKHVHKSPRISHSNHDERSYENDNVKCKCKFCEKLACDCHSCNPRRFCVCKSCSPFHAESTELKSNFKKEYSNYVSLRNSIRVF